MNPNPLNINDSPMQLQDAAIVALIIAITLTFTVFMTTHGYDTLTQDPPRFVFDLIVFFGGTYVTNFGTLTGLTIYATRTKEPS